MCVCARLRMKIVIMVEVWKWNLKKKASKVKCLFNGRKVIATPVLLGIFILIRRHKCLLKFQHRMVLLLLEDELSDWIMSRWPTLYAPLFRDFLIWNDLVELSRDVAAEQCKSKTRNGELHRFSHRHSLCNSAHCTNSLSILGEVDFGAVTCKSLHEFNFGETIEELLCFALKFLFQNYGLAIYFHT